MSNYAIQFKAQDPDTYETILFKIVTTSVRRLKGLTISILNYTVNPYYIDSVLHYLNGEQMWEQIKDRVTPTDTEVSWHEISFITESKHKEHLNIIKS